MCKAAKLLTLYVKTALLLRPSIQSPALMKKDVQVTLIGSKLTAAQQNQLTKAARVLGGKRVETFSNAGNAGI